MKKPQNKIQNNNNPVLDLLLPYQRDIVFNPSPYIICNCSRQIGKSFASACKAVVYAYTHPGTLTACISTGQRSAAEFLLKCRQFCRAFVLAHPKDIDLLGFDESNSTIKFVNGSRITALPSGNPAALRGYTGNIILDEFALLDNDIEIWEAIAPLLTSRMNNQDKWCIILSTPTSLNTVFAKIWFNTDKMWYKKQLTIYDAVSQGLKADPEHLKKLINDDLIWNTEYMCEFVSKADIPFDPALIEECSGKAIFNKNNNIAIGVDVARTSDLTTFVVIQCNNNQNQVIDVVTQKDTPFNIQLSTLKELFQKYNVKSGYIDATGIGRMFAEEAQRTISPRLKPYIFNASNKTQIYDRLRKAIINKELTIPIEHLELMKSDLAMLRRVVGSNGQISYQAPHTSGGHADIACALALAVQSITDNKSTDVLPITYAMTNNRWI